MKFVYTLILLFLSGCDSINLAPTYVSSEKVELTNEIQKSAAKRITKKTDLVLCGTGGGMMNEIRMVALSFDYYKPVNQIIGRKLLITASEELLNEINQNEKVRKYLIRYPFPPKNIQIRIFVHNKNGSPIQAGNICYLSVIDGVLSYTLREPGKFKSSTLTKESYIQALQKISQSRFSVM